MRNLKWIIIAGVCLLVACKKNNQILVEGKLLEFYSLSAIADAKIELAYAPITYGSVSSGYEAITSTRSDDQGNFKLEFDEVSTPTYRLRVMKDGFITEVFEVAASEWSSDRVNYVDLSLYAGASITFRIVNESRLGDRALLKLGKHSEGCSTCCFQDQSILIDVADDTTFTCEVYGFQSIPYEWSKLSGPASETEKGELEVEIGVVDFEFKY